jgi:hypothetical protein
VRGGGGKKEDRENIGLTKDSKSKGNLS